MVGRRIKTFSDGSRHVALTPTAVDISRHPNELEDKPDPDPDPVAAFTMQVGGQDVVEVETGVEVTFDGASSTGANDYSWDDAVDPNDPHPFGSYPLGTGESITFTFQGTGTKHPRLRVSNDSGQDDEIKTLQAVSPTGGESDTPDASDSGEGTDTSIVEKPTGGGGDSPTTMQSSVSRHGITWTFDGSYQVGQYANGDWFVVGPVTVDSISPSGSQEHGSMLNPGQSTSQGFVNGSFSGAPGYSSSLDVSTDLPLTLQAGDSLVSTETIASDRPFVDTAVVLTCVSAVPPVSSFRPPYTANPPSGSWREADLNYTVLPNLTAPDSAPSFSQAESMFDRFWLDAPTHWEGRFWHPDTAMPDYGRDLASQINQGVLALCLDGSDAQKRDLLVGLVQIGIDSYGALHAGGSWNGADGWYHNGGHASGRKLPIMLAGLVLGDSDLTDAAADTGNWFGEDDQTFYVDGNNLEGSGYSSDMDGMPEWGIRHRADASRDDSSPSTSYRRNQTGAAFAGITLAALLLGLKDAWNHDALFDYMDRYHGVINDPDWPNLSGVTDTWPSIDMFTSQFERDMWVDYRGSV